MTAKPKGNPEAPALLSNAKAAEYLGVTPGTLEVWRSKKSHAIEYVKVGRLVRYRAESLDKFLASRTRV